MKVAIVLDSSPQSINALKYYYQSFHKPANSVHIYHANIPPNLPTYDLKSASFAVEPIQKIMLDHNKKELELETLVDDMAMEFGGKKVDGKKWETLDNNSYLAEKVLMFVEGMAADLVILGQKDKSKGKFGFKRYLAKQRSSVSEESGVKSDRADSSGANSRHEDDQVDKEIETTEETQDHIADLSVADSDNPFVNSLPAKTEKADRRSSFPKDDIKKHLSSFAKMFTTTTANVNDQISKYCGCPVLIHKS